MTESNDVSRDKRLANLRPWQPGQSGNPRGRSRGSVNLTNALLRVLKRVAAPEQDKRTWAEVFAQRLVELACDGNSRAIQEVLGRVEGPIPGVVEANMVDNVVRIVIGDPPEVNERTDLAGEDRPRPGEHSPEARKHG